MSSTVRLRPHTHQTLREITDLTGQPMQDVLDRAVEDLRRKVYLEGLSADYSAIRADPKSSKALDAENAVWNSTNQDGLEDL
jgi:hypothetical protein